MFFLPFNPTGIEWFRSYCVKNARSPSCPFLKKRSPCIRPGNRYAHGGTALVMQTWIQMQKLPILLVLEPPTVLPSLKSPHNPSVLSSLYCVSARVDEETCTSSFVLRLAPPGPE